MRQRYYCEDNPLPHPPRPVLSAEAEAERWTVQPWLALREDLASGENTEEMLCRALALYQQGQDLWLYPLLVLQSSLSGQTGQMLEKDLSCRLQQEEDDCLKSLERTVRELLAAALASTRQRQTQFDREALARLAGLEERRRQEADRLEEAARQVKAQREVRDQQAQQLRQTTQTRQEREAQLWSS